MRIPDERLCSSQLVAMAYFTCTLIEHLCYTVDMGSALVVYSSVDILRTR